MFEILKEIANKTVNPTTIKWFSKLEFLITILLFLYSIYQLFGNPTDQIDTGFNAFGLVAPFSLLIFKYVLVRFSEYNKVRPKIA